MTPEDKAPPAGGFGAPQPYQHTKIGHRPLAKEPSRSGMLVLIGGIVGATVLVLLWVGARKYMSGVRMVPGAEARNGLGQIGKDLAYAYEERGVLCPSARAVPRDPASVRGKKYESKRTDWTDDPGWSCVGFEMNAAQHYQYRFETVGDDVTAIAEGDLDGDGVRSRFELHGRADAERHQLVLEPTIRMTNPDE